MTPPSRFLPSSRSKGISVRPPHSAASPRRLSPARQNFFGSSFFEERKRKQRGQRGQKRQKVLFAFFALFALFASPRRSASCLDLLHLDLPDVVDAKTQTRRIFDVSRFADDDVDVRVLVAVAAVVEIECLLVAIPD